MSTHNSQMVYIGRFVGAYDGLNGEANGIGGIPTGRQTPRPLVVQILDGGTDHALSGEACQHLADRRLHYDLGQGSTIGKIATEADCTMRVTRMSGARFETRATALRLDNGDVFLNGASHMRQFAEHDITGVEVLAIDSTLKDEQTNATGRIAPSKPDTSGTVSFCIGTLIETEDGPKGVEHLETGDLIMTRDHGLQPIRWIGSRVSLVSQADAPIIISAGALAPGIPSATLRLSPLHRVMVSSVMAERMFGTREVFVYAKSLLALPDVTQAKTARFTRYWHIAMEAHHVISVHNAPVETLFPGKVSLQTLSDAQRAGLQGVFGDLGLWAERTALARPCPPLRRQQALVAKAAKTGAFVAPVSTGNSAAPVAMIRRNAA